MSELPEGWTTCKVGDVFDSFSGGTPNKSTPAYWNGDIPWISSGEFNSEVINFGTEFITEEGLQNSSAKLCRPGSVLVVVRSGILKHTLPVAIVGQPLAINQDIKCFDSGEDDLNYWLSLSLRTFAKEILHLNREGTTVQSVKYDTLKELELPIPPLNEQRRIVAKLEKLLSRVDAAQARLATVPRILKRFRRSVLAVACSGRLTADWRGSNADESEDGLPLNWERVAVEDLLPPNGIFDGPFGSNLKTSDYTSTGVRVIRLENIGHLKFIGEKETYISPEKYETLVKHTVKAGDIIFASFIADEIRACVLPSLRTKAIAKADCFCLRPKKDLVDRTFLTYQLVSQETYDNLIDSVHGATRPRINTTQLRKLKVRVCPLAEQQEIVRRVEALFKTADALEARYRKAKAHVDKLTQSVLARAFSGELVTTEAELARREARDYEPAFVLLERVRQEGAQQQQKSANSNTRRKPRSKRDSATTKMFA